MSSMGGSDMSEEAQPAQPVQSAPAAGGSLLDEARISTASPWSEVPTTAPSADLLGGELLLDSSASAEDSMVRGCAGAPRPEALLKSHEGKLWQDPMSTAPQSR